MNKQPSNDIVHRLRNGYPSAERLEAANEIVLLRQLLQDAVDDYAEHCEGGESDEWLKAARKALDRIYPRTNQGE